MFRDKKLLILLTIYLFINSLFVVKYTDRLNVLNGYVFLIAYLIGISIFFSIILKLQKEIILKYGFYITVFSFFIFSIYLNITVDGYKLNVDRWSSMYVGIKAFLNGEYPYSAVNHMDGRTSNLPTLIFIGIPFYLLGRVEYLQSFAFLVYVFIIYKLFKNYKFRLIGLLLLIFSPAYLWEVYTKSDLMSNFIFVIPFLMYYDKSFKGKEKKVSWLSFLATLLLFTRLTVIIPLIFAMFKDFYNYSIKGKIKFILVGLFTSIILLYIGFHNVKDLETFNQKNPFELQNRQLPFIVSLIIILVPFYLSFKINSFRQLIYTTGVYLFLTILISATIKVIKFGITDCFYGSVVDISFFNISTPFIILGILYLFENKLSVD